VEYVDSSDGACGAHQNILLFVVVLMFRLINYTVTNNIQINAKVLSRSEQTCLLRQQSLVSGHVEVTVAYHSDNQIAQRSFFGRLTE